jgi:phosphopantetheine--protein transferase-like protein
MPEKARITDVAIVGMGAVFPGAGDVPAFWRNVCEGVDAITDVPSSRWDPELYFDPTARNGHSASDRFYCRRGGFVDDLVDFDPAAYGIMPSAVAGTEPDQLLALRTASEAIADAGGIDRLPDRSRIGVIIGRGGYITPASARMDQRVRTSHQVISLLRELVPGITAGQLDAVRTAFDDQLGPASPESSIGLVPNFAASRVANRFDFRGPAYTVDAACASSLVAIDHAVRELASGRCDAVLAGAVHHCHVATLWSVFTQLKALSPSQAIRPFDRRADGTLMAEGTGIILLKRLADAERAGDRVYAVIRGTGLASDGRASSLMSPLVEGQVQAVEQAWREAGLDPTAAGALGLLEAHGTATPTGDQVELETLARAFGRRPAGSEPVGLGTVKSNIGHAMPAAGIAGLIKAALAVHHGVRPPTLHVEEPHPALAQTRFRPVTELEPWDRPAGGATPRRAAVNAFGFGGINAHVVLEEAPGWRPSRRTGDTFAGPGRQKCHQFGSADERVLLLTASTTDEMARLLAVSDDELLAEATSSIAVAPAGGPVRLAVVEPTARSLALARKVVARGTPWPGRSDVWFTADPLLADGEGSPAGKVAFLFPGFEPEFEPQIDDVADHFRLARPHLSGGDELVERSLDIIAVGRLLADALARLGVVADVMAGHSLGEWTAMIAAGLYERPSIDGFVATLQPGMLEVPDLVYAALGCGADRAAAAIAGLPDIAVSHDNCPHQSVICGARRSVDEAVERLRADQVMAQPMPFKSGFHSPMLAPYLAPVRESFDRLPIHRPSVPVWSATTVAPFPDDPAAVRDLVVRHLLEPVRFGPLTRRLHAEGVRAFVQVGPGSLPGFVDDTLKDERYLAVTANVASRSGLAQLRRVVAALWTEGRDIRWDRLATSGVVRTTRTTVRLDLGTPLVRLNGSVPKIVAPRVAGGDGAGLESPLSRFGGHPVLSGLDAALREATESARRVVSAWQSAPAVAVAAPTAPTAPPAPVAPRRSSVERVFSLADLPFVRDHCLLLQPDGWADDSDRFPVVPLTTLLELMADAARALVPGRTVVGFEQVRALRWLVVAPPTTATVTSIEAGRDQDGFGRVKVTIEGYSSGVVVMADGWPASPTIIDRPLTGERAPMVTARQLYDDRWMFHGPQFAGVAEVTAVADDGIRGVLRPLPAPGALLDSAGQLIGHWMQVGVENDRTVFPVSVDAIRLYGPQPAAAEALACTARITELTDTGMRSDATLRTPDGQVWCRIEGWATRRFATDNLIWRVKMAPEVAGVGEPQLGGWCLVRERWPGTASRELMMRRYLNAAERAEYEGLHARRQRHWLLGRVAAKDAVRTWLWDHGHGPVFPCEITVSNDPTGRPRVTGPFAGDLHLSIAHSGDLGVALVSPDGPVGIDVEAIDDRALDTERIGFTDAEHRLLDAESTHAGDRTAALVRFWAAKEAVAKARGTGFLGNPRNFEVTGKAADVLDVTINGDRYHVTTQLIDGPTATYAVAWTATAATEGE